MKAIKNFFLNIRDKIVSAWKNTVGFCKKTVVFTKKLFCEYIPAGWKQFIKLIVDIAIGTKNKAISAWRGIVKAAKNAWNSIKEKSVFVWTKIKKFFWDFVAFWRAFPRNFVNFWKEFGLGVAEFFRKLPETIKSKDKVIDLIVGAAATVIWCTPVFVVIYVLTWFLTK